MFKTLIIGTGFGTRVVQGCYHDAGMETTVVSPREPAVVRAACADHFDLVSVHSPPFLHCEHVNWALDNGHNVLCDKPFGVSAEQSSQMLERAREKGVIHLLNFEFRCDPARARVKEIIDSGAIGTVTHIHWQDFQSTSKYPPRTHKWQFERESGGWVRIMGTHIFDALRWLVGDISEVEYARARIDLKERLGPDGDTRQTTAEDAFAVALRLETGASAVIDTGQAVDGTLPVRWTVIGTRGMIDVAEQIEFVTEPLVRDTEVRVFSGGQSTTERFGPFPGDGHLPSARPWARLVREAVSEQRQIEPSFEAGLAAARIVDRVLEMVELTPVA